MRLVFILWLFFSNILMAQDRLPFNEIPANPELASTGNVIARMIHGLGYRYHWASLDLRKNDLSYRPSEEAASCYETLEHIYGLVEIIANSAAGKPSLRPSSTTPRSYQALREQTLLLLEESAQLLASKSSEEVEEIQVVFLRGDKRYTYPVWNLINGPLSDALYHTGQLVSFRRTTGNPIAKGVNVFIGKTKSE